MIILARVVIYAFGPFPDTGRRAGPFYFVYYYFLWDLSVPLIAHDFPRSPSLPPFDFCLPCVG